MCHETFNSHIESGTDKWTDCSNVDNWKKDLQLISVRPLMERERLTQRFMPLFFASYRIIMQNIDFILFRRVENAVYKYSRIAS